MPVLNVQNAEVKTATVEINTLTVSGKQVTLAVFRQLREEPLIAHDGTLNGVPWGTVNYHPDKCADWSAHWHVVWQNGAELRRSLIETEPSEPIYRSEAVDRWYTSAIDDTCRMDPEPGASAPTRLLRLVDRYERGYYTPAGAPAGDYVWKLKFGPLLTWEVGPIRVGTEPSQVVISVAHQWLKLREAEERALIGAHYKSQVTISIEALKEVRSQLHNHMDGWPTLPQVTEELNAELKVEGNRRAQHAAVREAIADLPQLFIAV